MHVDEEFAPQSPTYAPQSPTYDNDYRSTTGSPSPWYNTAPTRMIVQHVNIIDAEEHERLVNKARYNGPDFTKPIVPQHHEKRREAAARKRIYGDEYYTLAKFDVVPQFKMIKLDRQQYEVLTANAAVNFPQPTATASTSANLNDSDAVIPDKDVINRSNERVTTKKCAKPTPTARQSSVFKLTALQIPKICTECLSVRCYCNDY